MSKNNEAFNSELKAQRIARAIKLAKRKARGESVETIAKSLGITPSRVHRLIASIK